LQRDLDRRAVDFLDRLDEHVERHAAVIGPLPSGVVEVGILRIALARQAEHDIVCVEVARRRQ
jgi:hypothetical protein